MNAILDGTIYAPWTDSQVDALDAYQGLRIGHPYTCPRDHYDPGTGRYIRGEHILDATEAGWVCPRPECGYIQRWAYASDADQDMLVIRLRQRERALGIHIH